MEGENAQYGKTFTDSGIVFPRKTPRDVPVAIDLFGLAMFQPYHAIHTLRAAAPQGRNPLTANQHRGDESMDFID